MVCSTGIHHFFIISSSLGKTWAQTKTQRGVARKGYDTSTINLISNALSSYVEKIILRLFGDSFFVLLSLITYQVVKFTGHVADTKGYLYDSEL